MSGWRQRFHDCRRYDPMTPPPPPALGAVIEMPLLPPRSKLLVAAGDPENKMS